jgi:hypothetical protein
MNKQLLFLAVGCLVFFTVTGEESTLRPPETTSYSPVGVAIWDIQYPNRQADVYGLRLYGGYISHKEVFGLDLGVGFAAATEVTGVQLGLGLNWVYSNMSGIQIAGLMNSCDNFRSPSTASGLQIAGLMNDADSIEGFQISGLMNCAGRLEGIQLALINRASSRSGASSGLQIGLFNSVHDDNFGGIQLGLLNHKASSSFPFLPFLRIVEH